MTVKEFAAVLSAEVGKNIIPSKLTKLMSKGGSVYNINSPLDKKDEDYLRKRIYMEYKMTVEKEADPTKHQRPTERKPEKRPQEKREPRKKKLNPPTQTRGGIIPPSERGTLKQQREAALKESAAVKKPRTVAADPAKEKTLKAVTEAEENTGAKTVQAETEAAETVKTVDTAAVSENVKAADEEAKKTEGSTSSQEAPKDASAEIAAEEVKAAEKPDEVKTSETAKEVKTSDQADGDTSGEVKSVAAAETKGEIAAETSKEENKEENKEEKSVDKTEAKTEEKKEEIKEEKKEAPKVLDARTIAERIAASQSRREAAGTGRDRRGDRPQRGEGQDSRRRDVRPDGRGGARGDGRPEGRFDGRSDGRSDSRSDSRSDGRTDGRFSRDGQRPARPERDGQRPARPGDSRRFEDKDKDLRGDRDSRSGASRRNDRMDRGAAAAAPAEKFGKDRRDRHEKNRQDKDKYDRKDKMDRMEQMSKDDVRGKKNQKGQTKAPVKEAPKTPEEPVIKTITLPEAITLKELADKMKQPVNTMIKKLFMEGKMVTVNTELSFDDAANIALEYNFIAEEEEKIDIVEEAIRDTEDAEESLTPRPPVVCVMGHVDHGKTSLLDAIRNTAIIQGEAGGITQHIGAYVVKVGDRRITFLDTPGHEAFTAMRLRGAQATDIAILVVAADDGVMPQTVEAINHAKAAGIEIIVAINKIDKPSANIERVKQELMEYGLLAEEYGGSTVFCPVSTHTHEGIENMLEMILLTADMLELKANADRKARGVVIEARLDRGRGPVATLLVQKGTLHVGDFIAIGETNGRVRAMLDHKQRNVKEATPSTPVEILGLNGVPNSGEIFISTETEKEARQISNAFITRGKETLISESNRGKMSLDDLFNQMQEGNLKELKLIVKADVQGSVEAVKQSLLKLSNEEILIKCIHSGVGAINESDVTLASASGAIIIGFNIRLDAQAKQLADEEKVDVRLYNVIYNAIDDIEAAMKGMLDPIYEEKITGHAEIRQVYRASGIGSIAGSYVLDGIIERNSMARISRDGEQIFDGKIGSLKRFKDDVKEVRTGYECGIVFDGHNDIAEGDQIEIYKMVEVPR